MNKRICAIAKYINNDDKVIDVGCDQALLGECLAKRGVSSVASDIRNNVINAAKERISKLNLTSFITFKISDGLKNIDNIGFDTVVLSGMGTHTILKILESEKKTYKKIITISNNNNDMLRINMLKLGYKIFCEEIIFEKNKFYNLIIFVPGKDEYSCEEILVGKNHNNKLMLIKKLNSDLLKCKKIYKKNNSKETKNIINIIEKKLKCHYEDY